MGAWILTGVSLPLIATAVAIAMRFGRLPVVAQAAAPPATPPSQRALRFLRSISVSLNSGLIAGLLVAGVGGRFLMRVIAATSPRSVQGAITEADEAIGSVSLGGSLFLVFFLGLLATPWLGVVYRLLRPVLVGRRAWFAGVAVTALGVALFGRAVGLTQPESVDFDILRPKPLAALLVLVLVMLFGATLGAAHEWLDRRVSTLSRSPRTWLPYVTMLPAMTNVLMLGVLSVAGVVAVFVPLRLGRRDAIGRGFAIVSGAAMCFVLSDLVRIAA